MTYFKHDSGWIHQGGEGECTSPLSGCHPVVVIDPDNHDQMARLTGILAAQGGWADTQRNYNLLRNALREFADPPPPKPDEPTGLGAVAVDGDGDDTKWIRDGLSIHLPWRKAAPGTTAGYSRRAWVGFPRTVEILSEGVES